MTRGCIGVIVRSLGHHKFHVSFSKVLRIEFTALGHNAFHQDPCELHLQGIFSLLQRCMIVNLFARIPVLAFAVIDDIANDTDTFFRLGKGSSSAPIDITLVEDGSPKIRDWFCVSGNALSTVIALDLRKASHHNTNALAWQERHPKRTPRVQCEV